MLTVPGDAPESQRAAMRRAARMADLKVVRMVTEATVIGAGLTGGFTGTVLVYDLGSGCFVATVLRVTHDRITGSSTLRVRRWDLG
ncbi:Hsp70 family protein [Gordonia sp. PP30]|nr:Hsp70 family protein [Gordonia sp. PP30]